jgi:hypothetical protein
MVSTMVPERELECLKSERLGQQLMAKADPKDWPFAEQLFDRFNYVTQCSRIAGAGNQQDTIGIAG